MKDIDKQSGVPTEQAGLVDSPTPNDSLYHEELQDHDEKAEIGSGKTIVAQTAKQNIVTLVILVAIIGAVIYFFFFRNSGPEEKKVDYKAPINTAKPVSAADELTLPSIPNSPPPPPEITLEQVKKQQNAPSVPIPKAPTKPTPPGYPSIPESLPIKNAFSEKQKIQSRLGSSIMLTNSGSGADGKGQDDKNKAPLYVENFIPAHTSSAQQRVTRVGNMSLLLAQGKIIESVLETPINTNYPGPVRAIVSADVYSENGKNILVPRGSRLVGQFSGGYTPGQTRITLTWDRIIMPNGFDIAVSSPAIGSGGTAGVEGVVDTQIAPAITNAVLYSALNVTFAKIASEVTNSNNSSTTTVTPGIPGTAPGTTTNNTPTQQAITQQTQALGNTVQDLAKQFTTAKPFITLDQGTLVSVFVNRDILFPQSLSNNTRVVE